MGSSVRIGCSFREFVSAPMVAPASREIIRSRADPGRGKTEAARPCDQRSLSNGSVSSGSVTASEVPSPGALSTSSNDPPARRGKLRLALCIRDGGCDEVDERGHAPTSHDDRATVGLVAQHPNLARVEHPPIRPRLR
jgi:hypothetical protein